jgi:hypothetical protein
MLYLLSKAKRIEISKDIIVEIRKNAILMEDNNFDKINKFLRNNIPKEKYTK